MFRNRPFSLLLPQSSTSTNVVVSDTTSADLELPLLSSFFSVRESSRAHVLRYLTSLPTDLDLIIRRQGIVKDLLASSGLRDALYGFLPLGHDLNYFTEVHKERSSAFLQAIWRLGELELYVDAMVYLDNALASFSEEINSLGLKELTAAVRSLIDNPLFARLSKELPTLRSGLGMKKSVTLGINLDQKLRPVEAGIISINDEKVQEKSLVRKLFGTSDASIESVVPIRKTPIPEDVPGYSATSFPLSPLFQDLEEILKSASKELVKGLKPFTSVHAEFLSEVRQEIDFLLSVSSLFADLKNQGFPVCFPTILPAEQRSARAVAFYNPVLALRSHQREEQPDSSWMVLNDLSLTQDDGIQILTGPNQGGKTTYVQGIGLFHILAQAGLPVPAQSAEVSVIDALISHFPVTESAESEAGRLGEEAKRLSSVFDVISPHSVVLLNESLTSTSPAESEYLAEDIIRGLRIFGARAVYATHLHSLAARTDTLNSETPGSTAIVSLVSKVIRDMHTAKRTFKIVRERPAGTSYAADIARSAGIDLATIKDRHKKRGAQ